MKWLKRLARWILRDEVPTAVKIIMPGGKVEEITPVGVVGLSIRCKTQFGYVLANRSMFTDKRQFDELFSRLSPKTDLHWEDGTKADMADIATTFRKPNK